MKKKQIIYDSPDLKTMEVKVRSVIATSLNGSAETADTEAGFYGDVNGTEDLGIDIGQW